MPLFLPAISLSFLQEHFFCIVLGYLPRYKGYVVLDLSTNVTFISQDVVFHKNFFPFKIDPATSPSSLDMFSQQVLNLPIPSVPSTSSSVPTVSTPSHIPSSTRIHHSPSYLQDYHSSSFTVQPPLTTHHPLSQVLSYHRLSSTHKNFVNTLSSSFEPTTYSHATAFPEWKNAMTIELQVLKRNGTWSLVTIPPKKQTIRHKWVYKIKYRADGSLERYKAHLVAKGYT